MSNLVPILLDKDTGRFVARNSSSGTFAAFGYVHTQGVAATTWTIPHGGATSNVVVQVYDGSNLVVIPDQITVVDANNISITFGSAQAGKALIVLFQL